MAVVDLEYYPSDILKNSCEDVTEFDESLAELITNLSDSLRHYRGLGLAAPQIGDSRNVFIINKAVLEEGTGFEALVFVNPRITDEKGSDKFEEGCLSMPGVTSEVERSLYVNMRAQDAKGELFDYEGSGYTAAALQHELDHLDGTMFIERLSGLKRRLVMKKYKKIHKKHKLGRQ